MCGFSENRGVLQLLFRFSKFDIIKNEVISIVYELNHYFAAFGYWNIKFIKRHRHDNDVKPYKGIWRLKEIQEHD